MDKIILFYAYTFLENPHAIHAWQRELCTRLKLLGRIILAQEGINATLSGAPEAVDEYVAVTRAHPAFTAVDFKESFTKKPAFPRLQIKVKKEIVHSSLPIDFAFTKERGTHLTPEQVHELISQKSDTLVILDARNDYESRVGAFAGALAASIENFRDFPRFIDEHLDALRDKEVLMYCTGGIRCEKASAYVVSKNVAHKVYQLEGGIHRYIEKYPDGFFRGKNYVFDARLTQKVTDDILTTCDRCPMPCDQYENCANARCNARFIACAACAPETDGACSISCHELVKTGAVNSRPDYIPLKEFSRACSV